MVKEQLERKDYMRHLGGGVVLTGGGALIPGVAELALEVFGIPARIGVPDTLPGLVEEYQNPVYATAMGLVIYGSETGSVSDGGVPRHKGDSLMERLKGWMKEFF